MTDLEYIQGTEHGNYQYVPLSEIIENMMMERHQEDSYLRNTKRYNLVRYAKNCIRDLYTNPIDIKAFEITIGNDLSVIMPQDFVHIVRISIITQNNTLIPIEINRNANYALSYLQDQDLKLIFDHNGQIVTAHNDNAYSKGYKNYTFQSSCNAQIDRKEYYPSGSYHIDQRAGKILFSSDLLEKSVVIEYSSDGLSLPDHQITVHKHLQKTIEEYIYYSAIEKVRSVPHNEKVRALARYKAERHSAMIKLAHFDTKKLYKTLL